MATTREMAEMAFGNPGFLDILASGFRTVAPALSFGASFIPGVGPFISKGIDAAAGLVGGDNTDSRLDSDGDED